jgi:uncharacterized protein (AIM24 family)
MNSSGQPPFLPSMHVVDYTIHGDDMQFVEIELDPQEAVVAEAGGMMFMDEGIAMETIFGDGSTASKGFMAMAASFRRHCQRSHSAAVLGSKRTMSTMSWGA